MIREAKAFNGDLEDLSKTGGIDMALRKGDKGSAVKILQENLIILGYGKFMDPYGADGSYGAATEGAVKAFQGDYGLEVDGVAGPITQGKVEELLKNLTESQVDYNKMYEKVKAKLDEIKAIVESV